MEFKDRLKQAIENKGITPYAIGRDTGVSKASVLQYLKGTKPTIGKLNILSDYLGVSTNWLLNGDNTADIKERKEKTIAVESNKILDETIDGTPIYDIDATCGAVNRDIEFTEDRIIGSINVPEISRDSKIIFASGDSMLPLIASGDRIVIREILSWDYFNYGQVYLILTDEYRLIKRVRRHADNDYILLRSDNTDYDDIDLHKSKIRKLFIVENILSIKNVL